MMCVIANILKISKLVVTRNPFFRLTGMPAQLRKIISIHQLGYVNWIDIWFYYLNKEIYFFFFLSCYDKWWKFRYFTTIWNVNYHRASKTVLKSWLHSKIMLLMLELKWVLYYKLFSEKKNWLTYLFCSKLELDWKQCLIPIYFHSILNKKIFNRMYFS